MAPLARARVLNAKRLERKLRRIPTVMEQRIDAARQKGGMELVALVKQFAPVKSGELVESVGWDIVPTTTDQTKRGAVRVFAGNDKKGWYARLVEFGTRPHFQPKRGTQHPGATARPFFYPAYRLIRKRLASRIKREATKGAKAAARGA